MNNLDLKKLGVQELDAKEIVEVDGGFTWLRDGLIYDVAKTLFIVAYKGHSKTTAKLGVDAANAGMMFN